LAKIHKEHDPGPRGSPHVPQPPGAWGAEAGVEAALAGFAVAKVEKRRSTLAERQTGHSIASSPRTSSSNWAWQAWQTYSWMGMAPL
jgi:hypothetical protein